MVGIFSLNGTGVYCKGVCELRSKHAMAFSLKQTLCKWMLWDTHVKNCYDEHETLKTISTCLISALKRFYTTQPMNQPNWSNQRFDMMASKIKSHFQSDKASVKPTPEALVRG